MFLLVAALIWSCMLQPDENMLVSAAWAAHGAPEQHIWLHRPTRQAYLSCLVSEMILVTYKI
jgi:hypothetical protein